MKLIGKVAGEAVAKAAPQILDKISSALFIGSFLTSGKKEKEAKKEQEKRDKLDELKMNFPQRQADLISKTY